MATKKTSASFLLAIALIMFTSSSHINYLTTASDLRSIVDPRANSSYQTQIYIVHVDPPSNDMELLGAVELQQYHLSFLPNTTLDSGEPRLIYSYHYAFSGFAARLTPDEVETMGETKDGFLSAFPDPVLKLRTTYTPTFLGLDQYDGIWYKTKGEGIIIGVLDSGIPENHVSFDGADMNPPPLKWRGCCEYKGQCNTYVPTICNNKLIGAQKFKPYRILTDDTGHGSHCAGIAAGNFVSGAEVRGHARGTAAGMAPRAHVASYKICGAKIKCNSAALIKAMEKSISDGVDVLSLSIGEGAKPFDTSVIAITSFTAMEKGIIPISGGGNDGHVRLPVENDAPWILTVGASTHDRKIIAKVVLENGVIFSGETAYPFGRETSTGTVPLVYPGGVADTNEKLACLTGGLDDINVTGSIVMCGLGINEPSEKAEIVKAAGGVGIILLNQIWDGYTTKATSLAILSAALNHRDALNLIDYVNTTSNPKAAINMEAARLGHRPAPAIAALSSHGPSRYNGGILKPDIIGPGVNILSAWHKQVGPTPTGSDNTAFNFASGCSMATPHLAGIAALLKSAHSDWSPAMIKSAIMTTARTVDKAGKKIVDEGNLDMSPAGFFQMGAGQVNPSAAYDPGLVYDIQPDDYIRYLCGLKNYSDEAVSKITKRRPFNCAGFGMISPDQLNYPSISVSLDSTPEKIIYRNVTNVGEAISSYTHQVVKPDGVSVKVSPEKLEFTQVKEQKSFSVKFTADKSHPKSGQYSEGFLYWISDNGEHKVGSPISVKF
ncbi:subtilisin-like protease [Typha angustifolia]|uniref:subtilisin-like protease n=1 Tax=Typha angustifolia TaxID=59011 RepID=UPI003C2BE543